MAPDFDTPVDRRGTGSDKWDRYRGRDILPLWVADMDFPAPEPVLRALHARVDHGVFGYTSATDELTEVTLDMLAADHGWSVEPDWLVWLPGMVPALHVACAAVGDSGDAVAAMTPVYPPFLQAPARAGRRLVRIPLADADGTMDIDALESAIDRRTRVLLLCNPQNPTGRVYSEAELRGLAAVCERHDLVIVSDEIHCGLILEPGLRHCSIAALDPAIAARTITLVAASKTYNIAGLGCALAIIPDPGLRQRFRKVRAGFVPGVNTLGYTATLAAWRHGAAWRQALLDCLRRNRDIVQAAVDHHPLLSMQRPQATYLAWIDCRALGADDPATAFEDAGLGLSDGVPFDGRGFLRLNFGCPLPTLQEAVRRLERVGHRR